MSHSTISEIPREQLDVRFLEQCTHGISVILVDRALAVGGCDGPKFQNDDPKHGWCVRVRQ